MKTISMILLTIGFASCATNNKDLGFVHGQVITCGSWATFHVADVDTTGDGLADLTALRNNHFDKKPLPEYGQEVVVHVGSEKHWYSVVDR